MSLLLAERVHGSGPAQDHPSTRYGTFAAQHDEPMGSDVEAQEQPHDTTPMTLKHRIFRFVEDPDSSAPVRRALLFVVFWSGCMWVCGVVVVVGLRCARNQRSLWAPHSRLAVGLLYALFNIVLTCAATVVLLMQSEPVYYFESTLTPLYVNCSLSQRYSVPTHK